MFYFSKHRLPRSLTQCLRKLHPTWLRFAQPSISLNKNVLSQHGISLSPFLWEHFVRTPAKRKLIVAFSWKLVWRRLKSVSFWPYTTKFIVASSLENVLYLLNDPRILQCRRNIFSCHKFVYVAYIFYFHEGSAQAAINIAVKSRICVHLARACRFLSCCLLSLLLPSFRIIQRLKLNTSLT